MGGGWCGVWGVGGRVVGVGCGGRRVGGCVSVNVFVYIPSCVTRADELTLSYHKWSVLLSHI